MFRFRKPVTAADRRAYDMAFQAKVREIEKARMSKRMEAIRARATADAIRSTTTPGEKLGSAIRRFGDQVKKIDTEKLDAYITGGPKKKKEV